jgi:hypothetical protein
MLHGVTTHMSAPNATVQFGIIIGASEENCE